MDSIHELRLQQAELTAKRSKCVSRKVGAIITVGDRIVSEGFNGTPKGYINCCDYFDGEYTEKHHEWSNTHEIHAEMNAINWASRKGIALEGGIMYSTLKPCLQCTKNIIAVGITEIYYKQIYERNDDAVLDEFIAENGIIIKQL